MRLLPLAVTAITTVVFSLATSCTRDDVLFGAACDIDDDCDDAGYVCVDKACVPATVRDALAEGEGDGDVGGEGEGDVGEGEGEGSVVLGLGAQCSIRNDRCDDGLRCFGILQGGDTGRCRQVCGTYDAGRRIGTETGGCPAQTACAAPTPLPGLLPTLDVLLCLDVAAENDVCLATTDVGTLTVNDDVCVDDAQRCTVVARGADTGSGRPATALACRTVCTSNADCAAQPGTLCLPENADTSGTTRKVCARPARFATSGTPGGDPSIVCDTAAGVGDDPTPIRTTTKPSMNAATTHKDGPDPL